MQSLQDEGPIDGGLDRGAGVGGDGDARLTGRSDGGDRAEVFGNSCGGLQNAEGDGLVPHKLASGGDVELGERIFPRLGDVVGEVRADFFKSESGEMPAVPWFSMAATVRDPEEGPI